MLFVGSGRLADNFLMVFSLQRPGDFHGCQSHLYFLASVPGRDHGMGDDCAGDPGAWIW